jgi:hypothetical protein
MSYMDKYLESIKFSSELGLFDPINKEKLEEYYLSCANNTETNSVAKNSIKNFIESFIKDIPKVHISGCCHAISHSIFEHYKKTNFYPSFNFNITIGNVFYKGKNIYNTSRDTIITEIINGPKSRSQLPLHVWLTFEDMTVFDPTIIISLIDKGVSLEQQDHYKLLIWNEDAPSNFLYEPLLVDNDFLSLVDEVNTKITRV